MLDVISERCQMLAQYPEAGRERHDLLINLRSFTVSKYVIFYQAIGNGIEVLWVLHGSRDVPSAFDDIISKVWFC